MSPATPFPTPFHGLEVPRPPRPSAAGALRADVCVVGGGISGCSAALHLAERGYSVVLLEARQVAFGASGRAGGQLIAGFNRDPSEITRLVGPADAQALWRLAEEAQTLTRALIARHAIACALTDGHVQVAVRRGHVDSLRAMADEWTALGRRDLELWDAAATRQRINSPRYIGGLHDPHGGHLDPLAYTAGLARAAEAAGAQVFEGSPVTAWTPLPGNRVRVSTPAATVEADHLILAGNAFHWGLEPRRLGRTIMPASTFMVATDPLGHDRAQGLVPGRQAVNDLSLALDYFRLSPDHRLLFGGGVSYSRRDPADIAAALRRAVLRVFPQLADVGIAHAWSGQVAITVNRLPQFGRLAPNVLFLQGYSGHGLALAGLAGGLAAEAVAGQAERFDVFARIPHAAFPGGRLLRTPLLVLGMAWRRLSEML